MKNLLGFVLGQLDTRKPAWTEVSRATGVPYDTLKKIATRRTSNPGVQHVQRLADFFIAQDQAQGAPSATHDRRDPNRVNPFSDLDRRAAAPDAA